MKKRLLLIALFSIYICPAFAQITLVKNFPNNGGASTFEPLNNLIIFNATDGLWRSDGTTAGTTLLTANASFSRTSYRRCRVGNLIYFWGGADSQGRTTLWKTDGTATGTVLVKAFPDGHDYGPLVNVNGLLLFGFTTSNTGTEVWRSDGTETGTGLVIDLMPGPDDGMTYSSVQSAVLDGFFYFQGPLSERGVAQPGKDYALYRTDGTAAGTERVPNGGYQPFGMNVLNGRLIYSATVPYDYTCGGIHSYSDPRFIMVIEGGVARLLAPPVTITRSDCEGRNPLGSTFDNTVKFIKSSGYLYFQGTTTVKNQAGSIANLWRTDGTTAGTIQLTNFAEDSGEGPVGSITDRNSISDFGFTDIAYFSVFTNAAGSELWRSDGTAGGTYLVKDINPGTGGSGPANGTAGRPDYGPIDFRNVNGITYFFASDGTNGFELWRTDGTGTGTQMVQDLNPGAASQSLVSYNDNVNGNSAGGIYYFSGDDTNDTGSGNGLFAVLPPVMYTIKAGNWNDPSTWSGNRIPLITDTLTLNHAVTLPSNYLSQAMRLIYSTNGQLLFSAGGQLKLGNN